MDVFTIKKIMPCPLLPLCWVGIETRYTFYSVRTLICQQSPKLTLTGSDMGLVLTARVYLITKLHECHCLLYSSQTGRLYVCIKDKNKCPIHNSLTIY